jgi:hypothetical protein
MNSKGISRINIILSIFGISFISFSAFILIKYPYITHIRKIDPEIKKKAESDIQQYNQIYNSTYNHSDKLDNSYEKVINPIQSSINSYSSSPEESCGFPSLNEMLSITQYLLSLYLTTDEFYPHNLIQQYFIHGANALIPSFYKDYQFNEHPDCSKDNKSLFPKDVETFLVMAGMALPLYELKEKYGIYLPECKECKGFAVEIPVTGGWKSGYTDAKVLYTYKLGSCSDTVFSQWKGDMHSTATLNYSDGGKDEVANDWPINFDATSGEATVDLAGNGEGIAKFNVTKDTMSVNFKLSVKFESSGQGTIQRGNPGCTEQN